MVWNRELVLDVVVVDRQTVLQSRSDERAQRMDKIVDSNVGTSLEIKLRGFKNVRKYQTKHRQDWKMSFFSTAAAGAPATNATTGAPLFYTTAYWENLYLTFTANIITFAVRAFVARRVRASLLLTGAHIRAILLLVSFCSASAGLSSRLSFNRCSHARSNEPSSTRRWQPCPCDRVSVGQIKNVFLTRLAGRQFA